MTITVTSIDDGTLGCCPCIPAEGLPTVLVVITCGNACMRARLTSDNALRLGKALSEAGGCVNPHSASWHDREAVLTEEIAG